MSIKSKELMKQVAAIKDGSKADVLNDDAIIIPIEHKIKELVALAFTKAADLIMSDVQDGDNTAVNYYDNEIQVKLGLPLAILSETDAKEISNVYYEFARTCIHNIYKAVCYMLDNSDTVKPIQYYAYLRISFVYLLVCVLKLSTKYKYTYDIYEDKHRIIRARYGTDIDMGDLPNELTVQEALDMLYDSAANKTFETLLDEIKTVFDNLDVAENKDTILNLSCIRKNMGLIDKSVTNDYICYEVQLLRKCRYIIALVCAERVKVYDNFAARVAAVYMDSDDETKKEILRDYPNIEQIVRQIYKDESHKKIKKVKVTKEKANKTEDPADDNTEDPADDNTEDTVDNTEEPADNIEPNTEKPVDNTEEPTTDNVETVNTEGLTEKEKRILAMTPEQKEKKKKMVAELEALKSAIQNCLDTCAKARGKTEKETAIKALVLKGMELDALMNKYKDDKLLFTDEELAAYRAFNNKCKAYKIGKHSKGKQKSQKGKRK